MTSYFDDDLLDDPLFDIRVDDLGDQCVVHVVGELDINTAPRLREQMHRVVARSTAPTVVLDLSELTFCDARGLGTMVSARKTADRTGKQLVLVGASRSFRRLIRLSRLEGLLDVR